MSDNDSPLTPQSPWEGPLIRSENSVELAHYQADLAAQAAAEANRAAANAAHAARIATRAANKAAKVAASLNLSAKRYQGGHAAAAATATIPEL